LTTCEPSNPNPPIQSNRVITNLPGPSVALPAFIFRQALNPDSSQPHPSLIPLYDPRRGSKHTSRRTLESFVALRPYRQARAGTFVDRSTSSIHKSRTQAAARKVEAGRQAGRQADRQAGTQEAGQTGRRAGRQAGSEQRVAFVHVVSLSSGWREPFKQRAQRAEDARGAGG
jgi:hypothetical protein